MIGDNWKCLITGWRSALAKKIMKWLIVKWFKIPTVKKLGWYLIPLVKMLMLSKWATAAAISSWVLQSKLLDCSDTTLWCQGVIFRQNRRFYCVFRENQRFWTIFGRFWHFNAKFFCKIGVLKAFSAKSTFLDDFLAFLVSLY